MLAALAAASAPPRTATAAASGLVAAYAFDAGSGTTAADASGNGNNGTISGATWTTGKYGGALQFNGTSSLMSVPDAASLHLTTALTLEAWVDPSTVTALWRDVIYKGNDNYYLEATSTNASKPDAGLIAGGSYGDAFGTAALPANTWSYLAETYDGSNVRLYVNGIQVASTAHTGAISPSTNPLQIGGDTLYKQYFSGLIDEVRIYNVALTPSQIQTDQVTPISAPDTQPPSQPGTLSANAVSAGEIDLSWGAATDNVGVTGYLVERCQGAGCSNFAQIGTVGGTTLTYKDTTVAASTSYSYRVRATDAANNTGPYSNTATQTTPTPDTQPPGQPGTLSVNAASAGEIDLSWGAATDNVGVTGYLIERCQGAGCSSFAQITSVGGTTLTYADTTVSASTSYSYRVRATDAANNLGAYGNTATTSTPASTAPSGLVAAYAFDAGSGTTAADASGNGNNGTISGATWTTGKYGGALQFNGTSSLMSVPDAASLHLTTALTLEAWVDPSTVTALWRDVIYKGNDNYYLEATSTNASKPDAGLIAGGSYGDAFGTAALPANTWSYLAETYDGSNVRLYVNGIQVASTAHTGAISPSTNPLQIGGDTLYKQYFSGLIDEVRIYNVALTPSQIQTDQVTPISAPDTQPPSQPGTLSANAVSAGEIDLSWGAATDNVGVTGYLVERCQGAGCSNFAQIGTVGGTTLTYKDTTVAASTSYSYRVRATDAANNTGPYSNTATQTTPTPDTQPPGQPGTLSVNAASAGEIDLSWGAATDNVGVTGYLIERCQGAGCSSFAQITSVGGTTLTYADTTVSASTSYSYRVRATDAANNLGAYGNTATTSTPASTAPSGLVAAYAFDAGSGTTAADASGNGNNGTISGATWTTGKYGGALQFNGTSSLMSVPDAASLHLTTALTLEAWVDPSTVTALWRDVIYKGNDNYYLEATSTNASKPDAGLIAGGSYGDAFGTAALPANTWSYLAETYDGSNVRLYVNGIQVASTAHTGAISPSTNPLQIGGDTLYKQYFSGLIDEVRIYNVALTPSQIQTDQNTPVGGQAGGPSAPATLTASAASGSEIDLSWGAATDTTSTVSSYLVERCQGAGCSNFAQIGTVGGTTLTYKDTTVAASTSYSYRVRATDAANNTGPYTNTASASTTLTVSPRVSVLTFTQTAQFAAQGPGSGGVSWLVDGVVGGTAATGTITTGGLYTPPSTVGTHTITAANGGASGTSTVYVTNDPGTFTFHNDNARDGEDLNETVLTPSNVNSTSFGKLFSYPLDGLTFASPLYVQNVSVPGQGFHNIVIVATENDSVYAFDADGRSNTPIWMDSFINPAGGVTPVPAADTGETGDIPNEIGITGTPVIDPSTNTIYVVAATKEVNGGTTSYVQRIHALDLATGVEKFGGPFPITASVPGTGGGAVNGTISFNPLDNNQRSALALQNGELYIAFADHGDNPPYHGWLMAYNASNLHQDWVYCTTPNAQSGGVWMGGDGITVDSSGNLYFSTGNGTYDGPTSSGGSNDFGDTLVKLNPSGGVADYFTPYNYAALETGDIDLGSGGVMLLPDQSGAHTHEVIAGGKGGTVYLVDRDKMGNVGNGNDSQIVQSLINVFPTGGSYNTGNYSAPAYFNGSVYFAPVNGPLMAFSLTNGVLSTSPTSESSETYNGKTSTFSARGGEVSISANGSSSGIVWGLQSNGDSSPGTLHAYDPSNLANEYWSSDQAGTRDQADPWLKFTTPLVANGRVYVVSQGQLTAYGLLP